MTQWEYDTIMMVLDGGAPAIADKLAISIQSTVQENEQLRKENEQLRKENDTLKIAKCACDKSQADSPCECQDKVEQKKSSKSSK